MYAVHSEGIPLNVRSGPGIEYEVLTRLPDGTRVVVLERSGLWVKITPPDAPAEGWVLERYLAPVQSATPTVAVEQNLEQEQQRFARLQRSGVITAQRLEDTDMLRLTINPLLWYRLTPQEQQNFLQRAKQVLGGAAVEMYDPRNETLLARLSATGAFEPVSTAPAGGTPPPTTASGPPQATPATAGRKQ
jgi:hypothetical protein